MIPYERRQILLNELEKQDMVTLSDFARALHGVSESTIRRDLKILEGEGQIVLLRGGAAKIKTGSYDTPIHSRGLYKIKEKEAIARTAAKLVHDGEVIYIDSLRTVLDRSPEARIVVNAISLETVSEAMEAAEEGLLRDAQITQIMASRSRKLGRYHMMTGQNPVYIISAGGRSDV